MKRNCVFFLLVLISLPALCQQDPQYNMYQFNQMIINPAYAGARDVLAVVALRRQQWVGFGGAPETNCLSVHGPVMKKNLGLGLSVLTDKMGPRNLIAVNGNAAYILKMTDRVRLSFGINAGYNYYQFRFSSIELKAGQLPAELETTLNKGALDINSGLYLRSRTFFAGLSATHLNRPDAYSYSNTASNRFTYKLHSHLFLTLGKSFSVNENLVFAPTTLIRSINGSVGGDLNVNFFLFKRLWLGGFYKTGYGPGGLVQFYFNSRFRAGLSYDTGLQDARRLGPSYEVMLGLDFETLKAKMVDVRFL
jgi:type IX secretion system PorP/SprF family membrane protein